MEAQLVLVTGSAVPSLLIARAGHHRARRKGAGPAHVSCALQPIVTSYPENRRPVLAMHTANVVHGTSLVNVGSARTPPWGTLGPWPAC
jgi:hypothetical protein